MGSDRGGMGNKTEEKMEKKGHDWGKEEPVKKPFPEIKEPPPPPPPSDKPWVNYGQSGSSGGMQTQANAGQKRKFSSDSMKRQGRPPEPLPLPPKPKKAKEEEDLDLSPFIESHIKQFCTEMKDEEKKRAEESLKPLMQTNFCVLCNARTSGPAQATTHYNGKNHLKKVKTFLQSGGEFVPKKPEARIEKDPKDMTLDEKKQYQDKQKVLDKKVAEVCPSFLLSPCLPISICIRYVIRLVYLWQKWKEKSKEKIKRKIGPVNCKCIGLPILQKFFFEIVHHCSKSITFIYKHFSVSLTLDKCRIHLDIHLSRLQNVINRSFLKLVWVGREDWCGLDSIYLT